MAAMLLDKMVLSKQKPVAEGIVYKRPTVGKGGFMGGLRHWKWRYLELYNAYDNAMNGVHTPPCLRYYDVMGKHRTGDCIKTLFLHEATSKAWVWAPTSAVLTTDVARAAGMEPQEGLQGEMTSALGSYKAPQHSRLKLKGQFVQLDHLFAKEGEHVTLVFAVPYLDVTTTSTVDDEEAMTADKWKRAINTLTVERGMEGTAGAGAGASNPVASLLSAVAGGPATSSAAAAPAAPVSASYAPTTAAPAATMGLGPGGGGYPAASTGYPPGPGGPGGYPAGPGAPVFGYPSAVSAPAPAAAAPATGYPPSAPAAAMSPCGGGAAPNPYGGGAAPNPYGGGAAAGYGGAASYGLAQNPPVSAAMGFAAPSSYSAGTGVPPATSAVGAGVMAGAMGLTMPPSSTGMTMPAAGMPGATPAYGGGAAPGLPAPAGATVGGVPMPGGAIGGLLAAALSGASASSTTFASTSTSVTVTGAGAGDGAVNAGLAQQIAAAIAGATAATTAATPEEKLAEAQREAAASHRQFESVTSAVAATTKRPFGEDNAEEASALKAALDRAQALRKSDGDVHKMEAAEMLRRAYDECFDTHPEDWVPGQRTAMVLKGMSQQWQVWGHPRGTNRLAAAFAPRLSVDEFAAALHGAQASNPPMSAAVLDSGLNYARALHKAGRVAEAVKAHTAVFEAAWEGRPARKPIGMSDEAVIASIGAVELMLLQSMAEDVVTWGGALPDRVTMAVTPDAPTDVLRADYEGAPMGTDKLTKLVDYARALRCENNLEGGVAALSNGLEAAKAAQAKGEMATDRETTMKVNQLEQRMIKWTRDLTQLQAAAAAR